MKAFLSPNKKKRSEFISKLHKNKYRMKILQSKRRGITKSMKKKLYPLAIPVIKKIANDNDIDFKSSSKKSGILIHSHIFHFTECLPNNECKCTPPRQMNLSRINKIALAIIEELKKNRISPISSEIPIATNAIGTCIDLIGIQQPSGREVLIEIKTGKLSPKLVGKSKFREPLSHIGFSEENVAWVQLMIEVALCRATLGKDTVPDDMYIVVGSKSLKTGKPCARLIQAPDWTLDFDLCDKILESLTKKQNF